MDGWMYRWTGKMGKADIFFSGSGNVGNCSSIVGS